MPRWKLYERRHAATGSGPLGLGLPRFDRATFRAQFPFARVELADPALPVDGAHHRMEPVRTRGRRQLEPARRGPRVRVHQHGRRGARRRVLVQRAQFRAGGHGRVAERARAGPVRSAPARAASPCTGRRGPRRSRRRPGSPSRPTTRRSRSTSPGSGATGSIPRRWPGATSNQGAAYDRAAPTEGRLPTGASLFVPFRILPGASEDHPPAARLVRPEDAAARRGPAARRSGNARRLLPAVVFRAIRRHRRARGLLERPLCGAAGPGAERSPTASSTPPCRRRPSRPRPRT